MNKQIETYIKHAMPLLQKEEKLNKEFKGYIASLGPAINMSGLIPAIAFYSLKENSAKAERSKVLQWIFDILSKEKSWPGLEEKKGMLQFALSLNPAEHKKLEQQIMHISIALKLCLRTFELTD